jgi:folate-binding protein YgfZ
MEHSPVVDALAIGKAFVDLSFWRKVAISGSDAFAWLNDLVSADISDLAPCGARRSLLLSPTGRIRAEFTVAVPGGNLVLIQDPEQPEGIDALLSKYVLSSDVELEDRTADLALFAFPGVSAPPDTPGTSSSTPSCTGRGADLVGPADDHQSLLGSLSKSYALAGAEALEAWRVVEGIARFGVDALEEDLPQEGGLAGAVSFDKGCFLGQEAVAKVRNLGHPRRVVMHLSAKDPVSPGEDVEAEGERVGEVTSVWGAEGRWRLLARIGWDRRESPFRSAGGVPLVPVQRPRSDGSSGRPSG